MIVLLGATGYIGQAFARELRRRRCEFVPLSRKAFDYTRFEFLFSYVRSMRPELVIHAAGYSGTPNLDGCELYRKETFQGNTLLPQMVSKVCEITNTTLGHVSSGCIYSGGKILEDCRIRIERNLNEPVVRELFEHHPERLFGFTERDEPNFCFRSMPCNFYSGTKALAEEFLRDGTQTYIWRQRLPFNEHDVPCNLLSKLQHYRRIRDCVNSLSHVDDFVRACLDLWEMRADFGIYNVTNPGAVTTRHIVEMIKRILRPGRSFEYWMDDEEFYREGAKAPRSNSVLDVSKLLNAGVRIRGVRDALEDSLKKWKAASPIFEVLAHSSGIGHGE